VDSADRRAARARDVREGEARKGAGVGGHIGGGGCACGETAEGAISALRAIAGPGKNTAITVTLLGGIFEVRPGSMSTDSVAKVLERVRNLPAPPCGSEEDGQYHQSWSYPMVHESGALGIVCRMFRTSSV
jgi:hypothetical protein